MNYPKERYTGEKPWINKDWLYNEYIIKDRSTKDIADEYGCKRNTIQCWLNKHKIKKEVVKRDRKNKYPEITKEFLIEENINKKKTLSQISKEIGIPLDTLTRYCNEFGINYWTEQHPTKFSEEVEKEICDLYVNEKISTNQLGKMYNVEHGTIKNILLRNDIDIRNFQDAQLSLFHKNELPELFNDSEMLYDLHWNKNKTCKEIGKMIGVDAGTIRRQMNKLGIKTKTNSESKIGVMVGSKHPNWKNGVSGLYPLIREFFTINLASKAVKRDNYRCQLCGVNSNNASLHVHHIRHLRDIVNEILSEHPDLSVQDNMQELYNIITHDARFLDLNNLITYCKDCHLYKIHGFKRKDN